MVVYFICSIGVCTRMHEEVKALQSMLRLIGIYRFQNRFTAYIVSHVGSGVVRIRSRSGRKIQQPASAVWSTDEHQKAQPILFMAKLLCIGIKPQRCVRKKSIKSSCHFG